MDNTDDKNPATVTPTDPNGGQTANEPAKTNGSDSPHPYKTFQTQEEFDRHSAGILSSAQKKAEKELLSLLGLKPDEKDKLAKFKEAYDATLTDAEKKSKELETLTAESKSLKSELAEKDAIITAITKATGKKAEDVMKYVKMARGLVGDDTTMEQALEQVFALSGVKPEAPKSIPQGTPPSDPAGNPPAENPFKTGDLTKQGEIFKADREKARALYKEANGKLPPW